MLKHLLAQKRSDGNKSASQTANKHADDRQMPANNSGVWWGKYNTAYEKYETEFPDAFPSVPEEKKSAIRYRKGSDGYWYDPDAVQNGKAVISCTGDIMCEPKQHRAYQYGEHYYFHPQFQFIRKILTDSSLAIGNLETTLTDITPYADELHRLENGGYHCNAPAEYLDAIRYAGFDVLVNANNHNCDSAVTGLVDTLDAMDAYGFMHTGTFRPEEKERAVYVKVNGIKLAVLSYATYFNKNEKNFTQLGRDTLLNEYSEEKVQKDIAAAKENGAEFIIVYIHWGKEYTHTPTDLQKKYAQQIADAGANYIVGSHSHSLQPHETLLAKNGARVPVIYSMGNFVTNETRKISKHCGILQLALEKTGSGAELKGEYFIPCYVFTQIATSKYAAVPTDISLSGGNTWYETLPESEKYIMDVMGDIPILKTASMTAEELCRVLGVEMPAGMKNRPFSRLCTQPRNITANSAYFGIIWNSTSELADAKKKGAIAIITDRAIPDLPCIVVDDVCEAYCKVFAHIRSRFAAQTIAVTGNAGKTTTKEILDKVLCDRFITLASPGNWNTRHTAMLVMQQLRSYHEVYLQEVHEGDPQSASMISRAIHPDYAIITNVGIAHKENFASEEDFKKAFVEIVDGMSADGTLYVNGDDAALMDAVRKYAAGRCKIKSFGKDAPDLDIRIENIISDGLKIAFDIDYCGKKTHIVFPSPVPINAYSAAPAFAIGVDMGLDPEQVAKSIAKYESSGIRQNVQEYNGLKLFLDCRSATPVSMRSSIDAFCSMPASNGGKHIAVIGEMHIGENSKEEHEKLGKFLAGKQIDYLFCYGAEAQNVYDAAVSCGFPVSNATFFATKRALERTLCSILKPGDVLLIKGGRRMYLNTTIRKLFGFKYNID